MMSPGLTQSAPRRNTWSARVKISTTGRRKVKAMRKDLTNQRLITQLLKKKEEEEISGTDGEDEWYAHNWCWVLVVCRLYRFYILTCGEILWYSTLLMNHQSLTVTVTEMLCLLLWINNLKLTMALQQIKGDQKAGDALTCHMWCTKYSFEAIENH